MKNRNKTFNSKVTFGSAWISRSEVPKFFMIVTWVFRLEIFLKDAKLFYSSVLALWDKSGTNFTFLYLKGCLHLVMSYLAGSPELPFSITSLRDDSKMLIRSDSSGIPTILPLGLRDLISSRNPRMVQYVTSLLSIFSVFPSVQKPKLSTIVEPFSGESKTLDSSLIMKGLKDLGLLTHSPYFQFKMLKLESASPLGSKSYWNSNSDLLALINHPKHLFYTGIFMCKSVKGSLFFLWMMLLTIINLPFFFFCIFTGHELPLGSLSVVKDQAGKGSMVGVTNYFIQTALYPLHTYLFSLLKKLQSMDGTFDQHKPLKSLMKEGNGKFYSFDLSAATDRLPIDMQVDILNCLSKGQLGNYWRALLDINWSYKGQWIKYAVGQPMGAYSSWAMLALTHHVMVSVASLQVGISNFKDYCILGDDIVIRNDAVAEGYLSLMKTLGVSINLNKSVISDDFAEFAKVWLGPTVNFTPMGAGLFLQTISNKVYIGTLLAECFKLDMVKDYSAFLSILQNLSGYASQSYVGLWSVIGLNGAVSSLTDRDVSWLKKSIAILWGSAKSESILVTMSLFNSLMLVKWDLFYDNVSSFEREMDIFNKDFLKSTSQTSSLRFFESVLSLVTPSFWIGYFSFFSDLMSLIDTYAYLSWTDWVGMWPDILELSSDKALSITSIDWKDTKSVKDVSLNARKISAYSMAFSVLSFEDETFVSDSMNMASMFSEHINLRSDLLEKHGLCPEKGKSPTILKPEA